MINKSEQGIFCTAEQTKWESAPYNSSKISQHISETSKVLTEDRELTEKDCMVPKQPNLTNLGILGCV